MLRTIPTYIGVSLMASTPGLGEVIARLDLGVLGVLPLTLGLGRRAATVSSLLFFRRLSPLIATIAIASMIMSLLLL